MCGVCGVWFGQSRSRDELSHCAAAMAKRLRHRGPDDAGIFADGAAGLTLGHQRLSVVDLSAHGHQPMLSASGRYVVAYNGEIYNHQCLRRELQSSGRSFLGHSDTEVILAAIEHWGINGALPRFNGMFAFALWDRKDQSLVLARDRVGIKPMYFGWASSKFVFGSELKAIATLPGFANPINRESLALLLTYGYIPAPYSVYQNVYKLLPGTSLRIDSNMARQPIGDDELASRFVAYWSAREVAECNERKSPRLTDSEAVNRLEDLLRESVARQMVADVPLGAFLSGGIDSSVVAAMMQTQASRPIKTFSIGFHEAEFDEAPYARAVAKHLGTDHHELYLSAQDALEVVPTLPELCDEPFADSSIIPTYLVSRLARASVTVVLSGDGGDELFGGYGRYLETERYGRFLRPIPYRLRHGLGMAFANPNGLGVTLFERLVQCLPTRMRPKYPSEAAGALARLLSARSDDDRYTSLTTHWHNSYRIVRDTSAVSPLVVAPDRRAHLSEALARMMFVDLLTYLPDDCLAKVDRASMAVGLEARVPLLDDRIVEFAMQTPLWRKIRRRESKWVLRRVLERYVPRILTDRPKMGFGVPIGDWLRGPLRDWAEALLGEQRLRDEGFFSPGQIREAWAAHTSGTVNASHRLWTILMFQAWLERTSRSHS